MFDPNMWKFRLWFETISCYFLCFFVFFSSKMPKERIAKLSCMDGEKYAFRKPLRTQNMTPSLVENTPFPQTCNVISNPLLHIWGLISSFLVCVVGRLLALHTHEDTHTHTYTQTLVQITIKRRLDRMCSGFLCVMTWTEDGRMI